MSRNTKNNAVNLAGAAGLLFVLYKILQKQNNKPNSNDIRWANWPLYLDYDENKKTYPTLEKFQSKNNIKVKYFEDYNDNEEFFGKVQDGLKLGEDIGYDIITPTGWMLDRYIRLGYLKKLDSNKWTNKKNLLFKDDPRLDYACPWQYYMSGFGWNVKTNPKGIRTLSQLFSPQNKGKIVVLSEMRDTMGIIMMAQGVDISKFTDKDFMKAIDFLSQKIKGGWIRGVKGNEYAEDLISGKVTAVIGWSGELLGLKYGYSGKFDFAIPDSGCILTCDYMVVPKTSPIPMDNIYKLFNYYCDPSVAAKVTNYIQYTCPISGAQKELEKINPSLAKQELTFLTPSDIKKLKVFRKLTLDEESRYTESFQKLIANLNK